MFFPFLGLISLKNIALLIKIAGIGAYCIVIYFLFVAYQFVDSVLGNEINWKGLKWYSLDIGNLAGTAGMAFTIHTMVISYVKSNINQKNNSRDVKISYFLTYMLYILVGVMGGIAVQ